METIDCAELANVVGGRARPKLKEDERAACFRRERDKCRAVGGPGGQSGWEVEGEVSKKGVRGKFGLKKSDYKQCLDGIGAVCPKR